MNYKDDPRYDNLKANFPLMEEREITEIFFREKRKLEYDELTEYGKQVAPIKKKIKDYAKLKGMSAGIIYNDIYEKFGVINCIIAITVFDDKISLLHGVYESGYFEKFIEFVDDYISNNGNIET